MHIRDELSSTRVKIPDKQLTRVRQPSTEGDQGFDLGLGHSAQRSDRQRSKSEPRPVTYVYNFDCSGLVRLLVPLKKCDLLED